MKVLVLSGGFHRILLGYLSEKVQVVNPNGLSLRDVKEFLTRDNPAISGVLITDEAIGHQGQDQEDVHTLLEWVTANRGSEVPVVWITRDPLKSVQFASIARRFGNLKWITCDAVRISPEVYHRAFEQLASAKEHRIHKHDKILHKEMPARSESGEQVEKRSFFDRFRSKPRNDSGAQQVTDQLTRELDRISRGISRTVAITGHRGSGLTSTAVNLASEASKRGLSTIIIDMDIKYRSTNMYFSRFQERTLKDEQVSASLIRTLARPQDYMTTAFNIKDNFWLSALGYSFNDYKLVDQFYTNEKLIGLISVLKTKFNLILLDMPMDLFRSFKDTMIHIDLFGLCVPNNLHAILSTIRNVEHVLNPAKASYLNAKSKVIVTKYNDRSRFQGDLFTADKVSEVLSSGLSDCFRYEMRIAGNVPYSFDFDSQIETDIPITNAGADFAKAYGNILLRLMEGA